MDKKNSIVKKVIKGENSIGKFTLKGFEKNGKFIGNTIESITTSSQLKKIAGIGVTLGSLHFFGSTHLKANLFKKLVIDQCIFNKQSSAISAVKESAQKTNDTLEKAITEPALEVVGNGINKTEDKIFNKGGER